MKRRVPIGPLGWNAEDCAEYARTGKFAEREVEISTRDLGLSLGNLTAALARQEGREEGRREGREEGRREGIDEGRRDIPAIVDRAAAVAVERVLGSQQLSVQTLEEQAESQYVEVQDDRRFRKFMEQFSDKKRARSQLYKYLRRTGSTEKTSNNRASGAKSRFEGQ